MERYREKNKDLHMAFIYLDDSYVKISWTIMWWVLNRHKVPTKYNNLTRDMYDNIVRSVHVGDSENDTIPIMIGLYKGLSLITYMISLVMDEVTKYIQGDTPWCMLFVDNVVLVDGVSINMKLELWS
jgi:hypothetical protein